MNSNLNVQNGIGIGRSPELSACAWVTALAAVWVVVGCSRHEPASERPLPEGVIALVGETPITQQALQAELKNLGRADPQAALERLIRRELLLAEVERTRFGESLEIKEAWRNFLITRYLDSQRPRLEELPPPNASELDEYYQTHRDSYTKPERREVALIYLRSAGTDSGHQARLTNKVAAIREQAVAEIASNADFGPLAAKFSDHRPSRTRGGNVGWFASNASTGAWPAAVMAGIQNLKQPGDVSPVISAGDGFYILKLIAWQPAAPVPLDQVRERVAAEWTRERARRADADFYSQLQARFPVRLQDGSLNETADPVPQVTKTRPPRLPTR